MAFKRGRRQPGAWTIALDPVIAAAAYLHQIPAAARALAAAKTDAEHARALWDWGTTGCVLILIWRSRLLVKIEAWFVARATARHLVTLLCALTFVAVVEVLRVFAGAVSAMLWPIGASSWSFSGAILALPGRILVIGVGVWALLALSRAAPRWGWAWLGGLAAIAIAAVVLIPPLTLTPTARGDQPISGAATAAFLDFVQKGGLAARTLYAFPGADPTSVDMEGLGPVTHAAVSQAALAAPRPETYAAIGHLLGHYRHNDLWSLTALWSGFAVLFLWAVWRIRAALARRSLNDAATEGRTIPLIGLATWAAVSLTTPIFNLFDQAINYRADDYAMSLTRDPDALCRWLIATESAGKADPSPLEALFFYDHPPLKARLENAMRWKLAHRF